MASISIALAKIEDVILASIEPWAGGNGNIAALSNTGSGHSGMSMSFHEVLQL